MKKRVVKRWMAVMLGATMIVSMAAGCGKGESSTEEKDGVKKIEWWTPNWDEVESKEMAAEFEKEHPDIKVDIVVTDWDTYKSKITTAISTDNAPEVCTMLLTDVAPFASKGLLEPMDELGKTAGIDFADIVEPALDTTSVDGKAYGVPFRYDGSGIYYNTDMLKAAGYETFPETWDEMVEMSKKLSVDGKYGFAWPLGNQANAATRLVQQMYTYGGDVLDEDGKCMLNENPNPPAMLGRME